MLLRLRTVGYFQSEAISWGKEMKKYGNNYKKHYAAATDRRTICEVLREIFWQTEDHSIRDKVMEATTMAKKMDKKLREYARSTGRLWDEDMWEAIDNKEERELERMKQFEREKKAYDDGNNKFS